MLKPRNYLMGHMDGCFGAATSSGHGTLRGEAAGMCGSKEKNLHIAGWTEAIQIITLWGFAGRAAANSDHGWPSSRYAPNWSAHNPFNRPAAPCGRVP